MDTGTIVLIFFAGIFGFPLLLSIIAAIISYFSSKAPKEPEPYFSEYPMITFKLFESSYALNPESWKLLEDRVEKIFPEGTVLPNAEKEPSFEKLIQTYTFSTEEQSLYTSWLADKEKNEKDLKDAKSVQVLLTCIQSEIDALNAKSNTERNTVSTVNKTVSVSFK